MDRKVAAAVPFPWRGAGSLSNTTSPGQRPTSAPSGILIHPSRLATIDMGRAANRESGGCCAPFRGEPDPHSQSNTMWSGPWPTFVPNGILIHPAVWPVLVSTWWNFSQSYTDGPDRTGQRSDSIGLSALQTVAQKHRTQITKTQRHRCTLGTTQGDFAGSEVNSEHQERAISVATPRVWNQIATVLKPCLSTVSEVFHSIHSSINNRPNYTWTVWCALGQPVGSAIHKNSSGDEIANVNFSTTTSYM